MNALFPDDVQIKDVKSLVLKVHDFDPMTFFLQEGKVTLAKAWALFDALLDSSLHFNIG